MFFPISFVEIVLRVQDRLERDVPFRPVLSEIECGHPELYDLLVKCWSDQYNHRPTLSLVRAKIKDVGEEL